MSHDDEALAASLLESLTFVAVEHEAVLDLPSFTNLVDLYAHHLAADGDRVPFESFVVDTDRLRAAARAAERATGVPTSAPAPLGSASARPDAAAPGTSPSGDDRDHDAERVRVA